MSLEATVVRSEWVEISTGEGPMRGYLASTRTRSRGAVIVLQEAFGVNAHIQSIANRLAADGYLALAPDLFHRAGVEVVPYEDRDLAMGLIGDIGRDQISEDVTAARRHLADAAPGLKCGVVGFCFGGRAAFTAMCTVPGLSCGAIYYGPGIASGPHAALDLAADAGGALLFNFGAEDPTIPVDDVSAIEAALDAAGVDYESKVYPGAGHAFACDARPQMFRPEPALDAWMRTGALLAGALEENT